VIDQKLTQQDIANMVGARVRWSVASLKDLTTGGCHDQDKKRSRSTKSFLAVVAVAPSDFNPRVCVRVGK
jgi:hypothetical protein